MPGSNLIPRSRATAQHVQLELRRSQISQNKQTTKSQRVQLDLQRTHRSPESERASKRIAPTPGGFQHPHELRKQDATKTDQTHHNRVEDETMVLNRALLRAGLPLRREPGRLVPALAAGARVRARLHVPHHGDRHGLHACCCSRLASTGACTDAALAGACGLACSVHLAIRIKSRRA